ncbi:MAG: hypothetical protein GXP26_01220 [Planctomycetes bacterium]|nr:hypothetical protein [Planctomycetota bacterium]
MFYRNHNLKRAIGLLGVALALLSGIQQGHSFCFRAGSSSPLATAEAAGSLVDVCNCCSRTCNERQKKYFSSTEGGNDASQDDSSPCPATCWCHQSLVPLGLPTGAPEPVDLLAQSLGQFHLPMAASAGCEQGSLYDLETTFDASIGSSTLRCAKLCRFLI